MRCVERTSYATNRASSALSIAALLERHQSEMPIAIATDVPIEINVATTPDRHPPYQCPAKPASGGASPSFRNSFSAPLVAPCGRTERQAFMTDEYNLRTDGTSPARVGRATLRDAHCSLRAQVTST